MADFSSNATQLTAPQGAGANVVAPATANTFPSQLVSALGSIFVDGITNSVKQKAQEQKNAAIKSYVDEETRLNSAVASGTISPQEAAARGRANFSKHASTYSAFIDDFKKAGEALKGFSEKGDVEEAVSNDKAVRKADIEDARKRGLVFFPGMSKKAEDANIKAMQAEVVAEKKLAAFYKEKEYERSTGEYNEKVAERQRKELSVETINSIAGTHLPAFQQFGASLGEQVSSGKLTPEAAQIQLGERFGNIRASIIAASRTNPELASPWQSVFGELNDLNKKLIDPKMKAEDFKSQYDILLNKAQLMAVSKDPRVLAAASLNKMMPMNAAVAAQSTEAAQSAFNIIATTPYNGKDFVETVVGNPSVEAGVLTLAREGLKSLQGGKIEQKDIAEVQASNTVNTLLKQTGALLDRGVETSQLRGMAELVASTEYGKYVTSGKVDAEANFFAKRVFQLSYEPAIINGIQKKMQDNLYGQAAFGQPQGAPKTVDSAVDIKFTGTGVVFIPKTVAKMDRVEVQSQREAVASLATTQRAINQLISIGAHMEGHTNYKKFWEENKHIWFPTKFDQPENKTSGSPNPARNSSEEQMAKAVQLTAAEQQRGDIYDKSPANIAELEGEIKKATNPAIKKILMDELKRLKGT